jgi:hypothetical protein
VIVDTLYINGVDIATVPGLVVTDFSGVHLDGPYRGDNFTIPGMPGQVSYTKVRDAYSFDIGVAFTGDTRAEFLASLNGLRALMPTNLNLLSLILTGSAWYCHAEYVANTAISLLNPANGTTTLEFINLDGAWAST